MNVLHYHVQGESQVMYMAMCVCVCGFVRDCLPLGLQTQGVCAQFACGCSCLSLCATWSNCIWSRSKDDDESKPHFHIPRTSHQAGQTDRLIDIRMGRQTNGPTDGRTDGGTVIHTLNILRRKIFEHFGTHTHFVTQPLKHCVGIPTATNICQQNKTR